MHSSYKQKGSDAIASDPFCYVSSLSGLDKGADITDISNKMNGISVRNDQCGSVSDTKRSGKFFSFRIFCIQGTEGDACFHQFAACDPAIGTGFGRQQNNFI